MRDIIIKKDIIIGKETPLFLIAGPCVLENYDIAYKIGSYLKNITKKLNMPFIFKASYDKANRTSINSFRGPGIKKGLEILSALKKDLDLAVISDVHNIDEIEKASEVLDIIQIPAFLCRQTDIIVEAAKTKKPLI